MTASGPWLLPNGVGEFVAGTKGVDMSAQCERKLVRRSG